MAPSFRSLKQRLPHLELPVLLVLAFCSACIWLFIMVADAVRAGGSREFDEWLLLALRNGTDKSDPVGPRWVEEMARDFTGLGGVATLTLITVVSVGYLLLMRKRHAALFVGVALGTGRPTTFQKSPSIRSTSALPRPWIAYAPARSCHSPVLRYQAISLLLSARNVTSVTA